MDVVVRGRNVEVPDHFRQHVTEKIERVERYDHRMIRVDVAASTVQKAVASLRTEGRLRTVLGQGSFVVDQKA